MLEGTEGTCQDRSDLHIARSCHCLGYMVFKQGLPRKSLLKCVHKSYDDYKLIFISEDDRNSPQSQNLRRKY